LLSGFIQELPVVNRGVLKRLAFPLTFRLEYCYQMHSDSLENSRTGDLRMSAIVQALGSLYQSIEGLEGVAAKQSASLKTVRQNDLFGSTSGKPAADPLVLKRVDSLIAKLELMLREG
jgi:hypothetical protein